MTSRQKDYPLAQFGGETPPRPGWFADALEIPCEKIPLVHDGARIELLAWGERGKPGLLLQHGNRAHVHWWTPVAATLSDRFRVAAISPSGMGASDWREHYSVRGYGGELMAAANAAGLFDAGPPVFVGHSFGTGPVLSAAQHYGKQFAGIILADTRIVENMPKFDIGQAPRHRIYPDLATALSRFRLAPTQPCENLYYLDWIARHALREVPVNEAGGPGWTWRFDPTQWDKLEDIDRWAAATQTNCPMAMIFGERSSVLEPGYLDGLKAHMPAGTRFEIIPDAAHHLMLDQPLAVTEAIGRIASGMIADRT